MFLLEDLSEDLLIPFEFGVQPYFFRLFKICELFICDYIPFLQASSGSQMTFARKLLQDVYDGCKEKLGLSPCAVVQVLNWLHQETARC